MAVRTIEQTDRLEIEVPISSRIPRHLAWLVACLGWPPAGFALAGAGRMEGWAAMVVAVFPSSLALVICVPKLVDEFSRRPLVLTRDGARVAVGRAGPFEPGELAVSQSTRRTWFGLPRHLVSLTLDTPLRQARARLDLLRLEFRDETHARTFADQLAKFIAAEK